MCMYVSMYVYVNSICTMYVCEYLCFYALHDRIRLKVLPEGMIITGNKKSCDPLGRDVAWSGVWMICIMELWL